jgi:hypothetical protein
VTLGQCYMFGDGCEEDVDKALLYFEKAAELGSVIALDSLASHCFISDPMRWRWAGLASKRGSVGFFLQNFEAEVIKLIKGCGLQPVVFEIGRQLKGQIDYDKQQVFGVKTLDFEAVSRSAEIAIDFYAFQLRSARAGVDAWSIMAKRLGVVKDMRLMIARLIWEGRSDAKFTKADLCD